MLLVFLHDKQWLVITVLFERASTLLQLLFTVGVAMESQPNRDSAIVIHLTPERYQFNLLASQVVEQKEEPDFLHVACENEPNVEVGGEVVLIIGDAMRCTAEVVTKQPPTPKLSKHYQRLQARRGGVLKQQFQAMTGIDPSQFPNRDYQEELLRSSWYLVLRNKSTEMIDDKSAK